MSVYYDGTKLLSMKDLNGNKPEIFMCTANRTAGKTTYFSRLCVNRYLDKGEKFCLVYRFAYELKDVVDKFYKDIGQLFFADHEMLSRKMAENVGVELMLDGKSCGYAVALNCADQIKRYSHMFSDVVRMLMDEFQSETNHYCDEEVKKFISIHTSIARGQGKQVRYVPVYMVANPVTILNPYYTAMGISSRLTNATKFLRGNGFVLEQGYNESASNAQKESGFNQAFASDSYVAYSAEAVYLNDNLTFIERPSGKNRYIGTMKYKGGYFGIREFAEDGIIYCDDHADMTYPYKLVVTTEDHEINYVMLKSQSGFIMNMKYFFEKGCFRFKDLRCKEAMLTALSY